MNFREESPPKPRPISKDSQVNQILGMRDSICKLNVMTRIEQV